jgi:TPR repeat protein
MNISEQYLRQDSGCVGDPANGFKWHKYSAELNNPISQHKMGLFYDEGLEGACEMDIEQALYYYHKSADHLPESMHNIAKIYEDGGRGTDKVDIDRMACAISLYSIAAARGFPLSQVNLGRLFLLGDDCVKRDREAGKRLLTLAAESGDSDAQMVVGMIHAVTNLTILMSCQLTVN